MLVSLMVKNLALIESAEVTFGKGLNILSGETGAGKSILMGSVNMALGGKVSKDVIRTGADYAYAELTFTAEPGRSGHLPGGRCLCVFQKTHGDTEHLPHQRGVLFGGCDEAGRGISAGHSRAE